MARVRYLEYFVSITLFQASKSSALSKIFERVQKGSFNNYMDQILPNFDPPPRVDKNGFASTKKICDYAPVNIGIPSFLLLLSKSKRTWPDSTTKSNKRKIFSSSSKAICHMSLLSFGCRLQKLYNGSQLFMKSYLKIHIPTILTRNFLHFHFTKMLEELHILRLLLFVLVSAKILLLFSSGKRKIGIAMLTLFILQGRNQEKF